MADDAVQPADAGESQGDATATDSGLYDLDSVAPDVRELLEPHIKAINGNVEKKFREAADERKGWQPYEELGLKDVQPDELKGLLEFAEMANDPDQFGQWWQNAGKEMGLFDKFSEQENDDLDLESVDDFSQEGIEKLIAEKVAEATSPIQEKFQAQEQERLEQEASQEITSQLEEIRKDHPDLPKGAEDAIVRLAYSHADEDPNPIQKGFEEYEQLIGQGEKALFTDKAEQPQTPEGPGAASTSPEKVTSFGDPRLKAMATERLKQNNA
jgi:hypothetical protein